MDEKPMTGRRMFWLSIAGVIILACLVGYGLLSEYAPHWVFMVVTITLTVSSVIITKIKAKKQKTENIDNTVEK